MIAEHLVYSTALAILVGMLCLRFTGRDVSWIIIVLAYAPDTDHIVNFFYHFFRFGYHSGGYTVIYGLFHTIGAMVIFAVIITFILHPFGIRYLDAFVLSLIGFGAHLLEDALVYPHGYLFLWPLYDENTGLGWLLASANEEVYTADFFHIANTEVLFIGLILLLIAVLIRTRFEGSGWIRWYMPENVYLRYFAGNDRS